MGQNNSGVQTTSNNNHPSRKPPGIEGKCMRCAKPEHQPGQKCASKNAKCKECHKIGHFYKVCQSKKRARRTNLAQVAPQTEQDTHINENGVRQPNPPMVNMLKIVNHIGATSGPQEKHLKFPIDVDPRGPYKHHLVVRVDTGTDVNYMNEKTIKKLFPKVKLSGDLYKFHLKPDHKPARHAPRKVPVHLETAFKEEIKSLVKQGTLEEVKIHTDWVNSYVIVEKDTGNHHSPNHTVKKKLRICLDPRDLNKPWRGSHTIQGLWMK